MEGKNRLIAAAFLLISIGAVVFLVISTWVNKSAPLFDEVLFLGNMELFAVHGLSKTFLLEMYDQAPGPLYQLVHTVFKPLTQLQTPGIRLVNVFMFITIIGVLYVLFSQMGKEKTTKAGFLALNLVAVPVVWQSAGMALTEIPAMFFSALFLITLWYTIEVHQQVKKTLLLSVVSGVFLGLSILGRTNYLVLLPALAVIVVDVENAKIDFSRWWILFIIGVVGIAICLPMFYIWEGFVPPAQRLVSEGDLKMWHGVLAFAYAGMVTLIINPSWFVFNRPMIKYMLIGYVCFLMMNVFWFNVAYGPLSSFVSKLLTGNLFELYLKSIAPLLMVFAAYFLYNLILWLYAHRHQKMHIYIAVCLFLLLLSCINVKHLFSSRYVAQTSVFLLFVIADNDKITISKCVRTLIGVTMGIVSLNTYMQP